MSRTQNNTKPMRPRIGSGFVGCARLDLGGSTGSVLSTDPREGRAI